jgi:2-polyprenyl-3-methyl-5-hydroxy-6-metoxy-1,4-benzoquinol methylase
MQTYNEIQLPLIQKDYDTIISDLIVETSSLYGFSLQLTEEISGDIVTAKDAFGNHYYYLKNLNGLSTLNEWLHSGKQINPHISVVVLKKSLPVKDAFWRKLVFQIHEDTLMEITPARFPTRFDARDRLKIVLRRNSDAIAFASKLFPTDPEYDNVRTFLKECDKDLAANIEINTAYLDNLPAAILIQSAKENHREFKYLYTLPELRGMGIATALIRDSLNLSHAQGAGKSYIKVESKFRQHYELLGFNPLEDLQYFMFHAINPVLIDRLPGEVIYNKVLQTKEEFHESLSCVDKLCLPKHPDPPKNWDSLAALGIILKHSPDNRAGKKVLDAGGAGYSAILPQLHACGFEELHCMNLTIEAPETSQEILYEPGDITATGYPDELFDFATCQSVIEHGVDIPKFLTEMNRILKSGGLLIISTDYWQTPLDTKGKTAFGSELKIFDTREIKEIVRLAGELGFALVGELQLECRETTVKWQELHYTFIYFTLRKR